MKKCFNVKIDLHMCNNNGSRNHGQIYKNLCYIYFQTTFSKNQRIFINYINHFHY